MDENTPAVVRVKNKYGQIEYHVTGMYDWDNFDSLIKYLIKYWQAQVVESDDKIYSKRSVLRANNVPISLYFDDLLGICFLREDGSDDQSLLKQIETDLIRQLNDAEQSPPAKQRADPKGKRLTFSNAVASGKLGQIGRAHV